MYLFLAFTCQWIVWHIEPLIPFSTITNISISVNVSYFTLVFFKDDCHGNPGAGRKWAVNVINVILFSFSSILLLSFVARTDNVFYFSVFFLRKLDSPLNSFASYFMIK